VDKGDGFFFGIELLYRCVIIGLSQDLMPPLPILILEEQARHSSVIHELISGGSSPTIHL